MDPLPMDHPIGDTLTAFERMSDLEGEREFDFPDLRGWRILSGTDQDVGEVQEIFVDPNTLEPKIVLLQFQKLDSGEDRKQVLVPWPELQIVSDGLVRTRPAEEPAAV